LTSLRVPTLDETRAFITDLFRGVNDAGGVPYVLHCFRVEQGLPADATEDERHAALLHDVLEDTDITFYDLLNRGYSARTVELVEWLTIDKSNGETYMDHMRMIAATGNNGLINIKLSDNRDNSDLERLSVFDEEDQARRIKKYSKAKTILLGGLRVQ
jgi:(p)ppGpp synthase/HD superfamily hydrolase